MTTPRILFDSRWQGPQGIARFGAEVFKRLPGVYPLPSAMPLFNPIDPLWLSWQIRRTTADVFFTPGFNVPAVTAKPFVFVVHDLNYVYCPESSDFLRRSYFDWLVRPACRRAARVLTVSDFSRHQIVEWSGISESRVVNVGNGVGPEFTTDGDHFNPGFPYFLYIGNRLPHKNLPGLITAFARSRLSCKLMLTGEADERLLRVATQLGIRSSLCFSGRVSDEKLAALIRGASAVVLVSKSEGFGLPIVEAMACGIPVVASKSAAIPEIAGSAALLVDPNSVEDIANALVSITEDSGLREQLRKRGLAQAARFTWEKTTDLIRAVLCEVSQ